jgi:hypothetical protein
MAKVMAHEGAAAAMGVTMERMAAGRAFGGARPSDSTATPDQRSIVLECDSVRRDVQLRLVLGDLDGSLDPDELRP